MYFNGSRSDIIVLKDNGLYSLCSELLMAFVTSPIHFVLLPVAFHQTKPSIIDGISRKFSLMQEITKARIDTSDITSNQSTFLAQRRPPAGTLD